MTAAPRYEDYDIKYQDNNMFSFMGLGFTFNQIQETGDLSPYITRAGIEEKFYSFQPTADEEERVQQRKYRVHDQPRASSTLANGISQVNGGTDH